MTKSYVNKVELIRKISMKDLPANIQERLLSKTHIRKHIYYG